MFLFFNVVLGRVGVFSGGAGVKQSQTAGKDENLIILLLWPFNSGFPESQLSSFRTVPII